MRWLNFTIFSSLSKECSEKTFPRRNLRFTLKVTNSSVSQVAGVHNCGMLLEREAARCNWKKAFLALPDRDRERADDRFSALSTDIALSPLNLPLNRYYNMIAYDHSR